MELNSGAIFDSDAIGVAGLLAPLTTWRARRGRGLIVRRLDIQAGELGIGVSVVEEEEVGGGGTGANKDIGMEAEGGTTQEEEVEVEVEEKEEVAAEVVVVVVVALVEVERGHRLVCSGFKEEEEGGGLEDSTL